VSSSLSSLSTASLTVKGTLNFVGWAWGRLELIVKVDIDGGSDLNTEDNVAEAVVEEREIDKGGKTSTFFRGRERTGLGAVPTIFPCPGKVVLDIGEAVVILYVLECIAFRFHYSRHFTFVEG
jgi:hypothetical protein